jgi:hypothetical protein
MIFAPVPPVGIRGNHGGACGKAAESGHELIIGAAPGTLPALMENGRIERGWIYVNGTRQDDGTIKLGAGGEMRFSPFDAISERRNAQITWSDILTASLQRLAFWRR